MIELMAINKITTSDKLDHNLILRQANMKNDVFFDRQIVSLHYDGYIGFEKLDGRFYSNLTDKGILAATSSFFKNEMKDKYWDLFKDVVILAFNATVAITAIYALSKDDNKINTLSNSFQDMQRTQAIQQKLIIQLRKELQELNQTAPLANDSAQSH